MDNHLVVFSGGQDSTICLHKAIQASEDPMKVMALCFNYGQRHAVELEAAYTIAKKTGIKSVQVVDVAGVLKSHSPLTSHNDLEQYDTPENMDRIIGKRVELTFVSMRNPFFLTIAVNQALYHNCGHIWTGICDDDNANYPDCTPEFLNAMRNMVNAALGIKNKIRILAPLLKTPKHVAIRECLNLPKCYASLGYSHTSYAGDYPPKDRNHSSVLREDAFAKAKMADPLIVRACLEGLMLLPDSSNYRKLPIKIDNRLPPSEEHTDEKLLILEQWYREKWT